MDAERVARLAVFGALAGVLTWALAEGKVTLDVYAAALGLLAAYVLAKSIRVVVERLRR